MPTTKMVSRKREKPRKQGKRLGSFRTKTRTKTKTKTKINKKRSETKTKINKKQTKTKKTKEVLNPTKVVSIKRNNEFSDFQSTTTTSSQQLDFFLHHYQSANAIQLSFLELESISDACILKLSESLVQDASTLGEHMKASFGASWKEVLCKKQLPEGKSVPGSPALLTISLSALRSLELLRGLRPLTKECHAAKLFSKHMKVEEQVSLLKDHVNIACGTPSRIKKLIDIEALGLSRLAVVVLDMQTDVKGYSLFTLPQVRDEFWDLYKSYFRERLLQGDLRVCLYGASPVRAQLKEKDADD